MLIVSGRLHVAPETRDEYLAGCVDIVEQARQAVGCLDFALSPDIADPGRINVYERWESDAALDRFRGSGPDAGQTVAILDAEVAKYRVSTAEAP